MPQNFIGTDFVDYPILYSIVDTQRGRDYIDVRWSDGHMSRYHHFWLRDNCPCSTCVNPETREQRFEIVSVPEDIRPTRLRVCGEGALEIFWSYQGHVSRYHPGWLRAHCYCELEADPGVTTPRTWGAELNGRLPQFAYEGVMNDDGELHAWLVALRDTGLTLVRSVPVEPDAVNDVVRRISFPRETNFGVYWNVRAELEKNSNAYTAFELPLHCDLPTREYMPGLQFLHCLTNEAEGGDSLFVDGFRVAASLRDEDLQAFKILSEQAVEFRNTDREFDYRFTTPMIRLAANGQIVEIRIGNFLRGPYRVPPDRMAALYRGYRIFIAMTREHRFQVTHSLEPGDLVAFDNRRILHARTAFDTTGGDRHLRGCYLDRDELLSRIRILERTTVAPF